MCLSALSLCVFADGTTSETTVEVTSAAEFVEAYVSLGNSGSGVILLKNDIELTKSELVDTNGASTLVAGSAKNNKIVIRGDQADTKIKLSVGYSMMFNNASGRTIEFDNLNVHSTGKESASQIAFNGNKVVFNSNCSFTSEVAQTDRYMGYVFLGSQGGGTASAHNTTINGGRFDLVAVNERGNVTADQNITLQQTASAGGTYVNALTPGNRNGGKNIGTANINVWGKTIVGNLYLTYNADREGSIYVNYGSSVSNQSIIYLTSAWNNNTVSGDVVIQVDAIAAGNKKILSGKGTVTGDTVLILNNGNTTDSYATVEGIKTKISAPTGVYAFAEKNSDGSFAHRLRVQVKNTLGCDKVVVRNGDGDVVSYSTAGTVSGNNTNYYLDLDETLDGEYTVSLEKTTDAQFRGVQMGQDGKSVRFIGAIDTLECEGVGLEIVCGSNKGDDASTTVYTYVNAEGETVNASDLASEYLFTAVVSFEKTDVSGTAQTFTVRAFKVVDGEKVYSTAKTFDIEF